MSTTVIDRRALTAAVESLEPLPASVCRLAALVADPDSDLAAITEVIAHDPLLTGEVLRMANSAASAPASPVVDVRQAVTRMGTSEVLAVAMAGAAGPAMKGATPGYDMGAGELWIHSVAASVSAEVIRARCTQPVPPVAVTAALLHDVGKMVLGACITPTVRSAIAEAADLEGLDRHAAETKVLGMNHADASRLVATQWGLPLSLVIAVTQHHLTQPHADLSTRVVAIADLMAEGVAEMAQGAHADEVEAPEGLDHATKGVFVALDHREMLETCFARFEDVAEQYF